VYCCVKLPHNRRWGKNQISLAVRAMGLASGVGRCLDWQERNVAKKAFTRTGADECVIDRSEKEKPLNLYGPHFKQITISQ